VSQSKTLSEKNKNLRTCFAKINYPAVLVAALSTFILGGLWYSPILFGKAWMRANNFADADVRTFSKARMFGWSIIFSLVVALNLAMFLSGPCEPN